MLRSIETKMRSFGRPRSASAAAVKRIITSGPQTMATAASGSKSRPGSASSPRRPGRASRRARCPRSPRPAMSKRPRQRSSSPAIEQLGRRAPAVEDHDPAVALAVARAGGRPPGAAARGRSRRPRAPRRCPRPRPPATRVPNGPRTPTSWPRRAACTARAVTAPTARIVCTSGPGASRSPLTEIGASPDAERVEHRELPRREVAAARARSAARARASRCRRSRGVR